MRTQFHFRPSNNGFYAWDVKRLATLSKDLPVFNIDVKNLHEVDEPYWYGAGNVRPTVRDLLAHFTLIEQVDLSYPIILSSNGRLMDGMHRVAKAVMMGLATIRAVQFTVDPEPDYVDIDPGKFE